LLRGIEQAENAPRSRAGQIDPRLGQSSVLNLAKERVLSEPAGPTAAPQAPAADESAAEPAAAANTPTAAETPVATQTPATTQAPAPAPKAYTAPAAPGFTRTADTRAPHLPRFKDVPQSAQHPLGPYRQAPQEAGGDWWLVSPFTGSEPWAALNAPKNPSKAALATQEAPEGFVRVFGARPDSGASASQWDQDLGHFQGTGLPEGFNETQLEAAKTEFDAWGLGEPVFYEGRYGWQVRFPDSALPKFETTASTALLTPHLVIAEHQVRSIQEGVQLGRYHPWLPERLQA
jgi:hypothetical protein